MKTILQKRPENKRGNISAWGDNFLISLFLVLRCPCDTDHTRFSLSLSLSFSAALFLLIICSFPSFFLWNMWWNVREKKKKKSADIRFLSVTLFSRFRASADTELLNWDGDVQSLRLISIKAMAGFANETSPYVSRRRGHPVMWFGCLQERRGAAMHGWLVDQQD